MGNTNILHCIKDDASTSVQSYSYKDKESKQLLGYGGGTQLHERLSISILPGIEIIGIEKTTEEKIALIDESNQTINSGDGKLTDASIELPVTFVIRDHLKNQYEIPFNIDKQFIIDIFDKYNDLDYTSCASKNPKIQLFLSKTGTEIKPDTPLIKADIRLGKSHSPMEVSDALNDYVKRRIWDDNIIEYREIKNEDGVAIHYMINKAPFPMSNRDFLEKKVIFEVGDAVYVYFSSVPNEIFPPKEDKKLVRAITFMCAQRIRRDENGKVHITSYSQMDLQLPVVNASTVASMLPASMNKWFTKLSEHLKKTKPQI